MRIKARRLARASLMAGSICVLPAVVHGQLLDQAQVQMLMEQAAQIQQCMTKLDPAATNALRARGERMSADIEALCKAGKREDAQAKALEFGREVAKSPVMNDLEECSAALAAILPAALASFHGDADDGVQVCDNLPQ